MSELPNDTIKPNSVVVWGTVTPLTDKWLKVGDKRLKTNCVTTKFQPPRSNLKKMVGKQITHSRLFEDKNVPLRTKA